MATILLNLGSTPAISGAASTISGKEVYLEGRCNDLFQKVFKCPDIRAILYYSYLLPALFYLFKW